MLNNLTIEQKNKLTLEQQKNLVRWSKKLNIPVENVGWRVGLLEYSYNEKNWFEKIKNWFKNL